MIALARDKCDGCRTCTKVCPHGVLAMRDRKAYLADELACIECAACQLNCANNAIAVTKGTGCLVAIVRDDILKLDQHKSADCCS